MEPNCVFCKIVAGEAEAEVVYQDELVTAFRDTRPVAPVHLLIVPNQHINSANDLLPDQEALLGHMIVVGTQLAAENGVSANGYRLIINTGPNAGQTIFHLHLHLHLVGGRHMPFRFD